MLSKVFNLLENKILSIIIKFIRKKKHLKMLNKLKKEAGFYIRKNDKNMYQNKAILSLWPPTKSGPESGSENDIENKFEKKKGEKIEFFHYLWLK